MEGGGHQDSKPESLSSTSSPKDEVELKEAAVIIDLLEDSEEEEFDYGESEDDEESGASVVLESHERDRSMINACARPQRGLMEHVDTGKGKKRIIRGAGRTTSSGEEDIGESVSDGSSWRLADREDDDDFVGQGMDEMGHDLLHNVPSEEEEDYTIEILQKIGTCRWCRYAPIYTFRLNTVRNTWALSSFLFPFWLNSLEASALLWSPPLFSCALATSHRLMHRNFPDRGPRTPKQGFSTYDNTLFIPIFNHFPSHSQRHSVSHPLLECVVIPTRKIGCTHGLPF